MIRTRANKTRCELISQAIRVSYWLQQRTLKNFDKISKEDQEKAWNLLKSRQKKINYFVYNSSLYCFGY